MSVSADAAQRPALVTGASRGLGRAIAMALAELGHPVVVNYRGSQQAAESVAAAISRHGGRARAIQADVSCEDEVQHLLAAAGDAFGAPAVVVNNAGIAERAGVADTTPAEFDRAIAVNLRSAFLVTRAALPPMMAGGWGRLVFVSSTAARTGGIVSAAYAASKAGIEGLMHYYATHLQAHGITANAIAPALFDTDMLAGITPPSSSLPLGRLGRPEEIAPIVRALVECEYMTGQTLQLNAGLYHT